MCTCVRQIDLYSCGADMNLNEPDKLEKKIWHVKDNGSAQQETPSCEVVNTFSIVSIAQRENNLLVPLTAEKASHARLSGTSRIISPHACGSDLMLNSKAHSYSKTEVIPWFFFFKENIIGMEGRHKSLSKICYKMCCLHFILRVLRAVTYIYSNYEAA